MKKINDMSPRKTAIKLYSFSLGNKVLPLPIEVVRFRCELFKRSE